MDMIQKLRILADAAKYDVSCSSSGSHRKNTSSGIGNAAACGICHAWSADGRCISLLKVLYSNQCIYNCAYCHNRSSNDVSRATFTPQEIAQLTIEFYKRNYIEGLFLSSAVMVSPDYTMEQLVESLRLLRESYQFNGYIHVKIIPGASPELIQAAGLLADRVSVNIELPSEQSLRSLAPQKKKQDILLPMNHITQTHAHSLEDRQKYKSAPRFVPAGQTTQLIIGATPENDYQIMRLSQALYDKFHMKRVYFSAYMPVVDNPKLPALGTAPPLLREHRLYQADWLLRFYGFRTEELLSSETPFLPERLDPKCAWALRHRALFPVDINHAPYEMLLRIPGIGVTGARKIRSARRYGPLTLSDLKKMRIVLKRAIYFIETADRNPYTRYLDSRNLSFYLEDKPPQSPFEQLSMILTE